MLYIQTALQMNRKIGITHKKESKKLGCLAYSNKSCVAQKSVMPKQYDRCTLFLSVGWQVYYCEKTRF